MNFFATVFLLLLYLRNLILVVLLLCSSQLSYSAVVEGLFHSTVKVVSQQPSDRQAAFNEALIKTLLKVSGNKSLVMAPEIQEQLFPAERFVQRFSYRENITPSDSTLSSNRQLGAHDASRIAPEDTNMPDVTIKSNTPLYKLDVDFSPTALTKKMKQLGLPVWGNVRPEIMLWGIVESKGERVFLGVSEEHEILQEISNAARDYALPISFPEADKHDKESINMSDLWGLFPDAIAGAKGRYKANGNVMVRFYQSLSGLWSANWFFELNELAYSGSIKQASIDEVNASLISFMSKILSQRFSVQIDTEQAEQYVNLNVSNIKTFKDYIELQSFLDDLAPVKSQSISWIKGETLSVLIELNGSQEQFNEYLSLSGKLLHLGRTLVEDRVEKNSSVVMPSSTILIDESVAEEELTDVENDDSADTLLIGQSSSTAPLVNALDGMASSEPFSIESKVVERYQWLPSNAMNK